MIIMGKQADGLRPFQFFLCLAATNPLKTSGLFQENPRGWGGPETNFFLRGGGCNLISVFLVLGVKNISVSWVVGVKLVV